MDFNKTHKMPSKNKLKNTPTSRGFGRIEFTERGGDTCSLQMSSAMGEESYIWLGANKAVIKGIIPFGNPSWTEITEEDIKKQHGFKDVIGNTRMHLTQSDVKSLLPFLKKFVKTGEF